VAVKGTTQRTPSRHHPGDDPYGGRGPRPTLRYRTPPVSLRTPAHATQAQPVTWRHGTKITPGNPSAAMTSHFLAIRVRPANPDIPRGGDGSLPECWLLAEWPSAADEPTGFWLSTLPEFTPHHRARAPLAKSDGGSSPTTTNP
jgi:hypothetical protein